MAFPSIKASAKGGADFTPVPAGVHLAICVMVVDLGFQKSFNEKYPPKRQVYFKFELPDEQVEWTKDGVTHTGPATVGRKFGLSISDKSHLRPFLVSWRGREFTKEEEEAFEVTSILGKICQLSVVHEKGKSDSSKTFATISGAFPLIKEQKEALVKNPARGQPKGELIVYSPEAHDQAVFDKLPNWIQEMINNRVEESDSKEPASQAATKAAEDFSDDIPF